MPPSSRSAIFISCRYSSRGTLAERLFHRRFSQSLTIWLTLISCTISLFHSGAVLMHSAELASVIASLRANITTMRIWPQSGPALVSIKAIHVCNEKRMRESLGSLSYLKINSVLCWTSEVGWRRVWEGKWLLYSISISHKLDGHLQQSLRLSITDHPHTLWALLMGTSNHCQQTSFTTVFLGCDCVWDYCDAVKYGNLMRGSLTWNIYLYTRLKYN